ncbi:ABC transporter ATP-binding protein YxdL [Corynebacterium kalinowskii]|uniref:ABC transporter ATP-binding protein YxdL n=1 Tax=Corynebacterium kalinowskii TaxID=2675216 RepID=A0A6B8W0V0_9CORY|nr:ABC transporter ATP-binding protein [Corynebacterium kalinowskii]QGU01338.1 ABC transporter ATP-binding protein YxdL [Corynebacterium kalinowskii]
MNIPAPLLQVREISRTFGSGTNAVHALRKVSVGIAHASFVAVMGPSGSGKSTFLNCVAGLDQPNSGEIILAGQNIAALSAGKRSRLRRERFGFVFQSYNLLPALTVQDNITLPLRMSGLSVDKAWAANVIDRVQIDALLNKRPAQLSGGQQQRVAIARALVSKPDIVFADEPTGALDARTASEVLDLLQHLVRNLNQTVVMVTHDPLAAARADRVLFLADGMLVDEMMRSTATDIALRMTALGARSCGS